MLWYHSILSFIISSQHLFNTPKIEIVYSLGLSKRTVHCTSRCLGLLNKNLSTQLVNDLSKKTNHLGL